MSTVLWANDRLDNGEVVSDESDNSRSVSNTRRRRARRAPGSIFR